jgi:1-acyl-sn-glycerol-3-phosphate acyltransferase
MTTLTLTHKFSPLKLILGVGRFFIISLTILFFLVHHFFAGLILRNEKFKLKYYLLSIQLTAKWILIVLNVKVRLEGDKSKITGGLIVSNHLSYLDVIILFSDFPSLFITSTDIRDTFLLGDICKLAGCFFVERRKEKRNPETKSKELKLIQTKFEQGFNIFLFPEGTSGDGSGVLPFKVTFFQLAVETQTPVFPVCLKYLGHNSHLPPWYGDMTFPDHLFKLCTQDKINVVIKILPEISAQNKVSYAHLSFQEISKAYQEVIG